MFAHLLVPLDGSAASDAALHLALGLARDGRREITFVHAVDEQKLVTQSSGYGYPVDPTPLVDALRAEGEALLGSALAEARGAGVRATSRLVMEAPVVAVNGSVDACDADLIVMGTQGRSGLARALLGSTTEGTLRTSRVPVMTVRATATPATPATPFARALVAVDDSEPADAAIGVAIALGRHERTELTFCNVIRTGEFLTMASAYGFGPGDMLAELRAAASDLLTPAAERARACGLTASTVVPEGRAVEEILRAAAGVEADLIIIGSHGRRGARRFLVGSVAEDVVRRSALPVLVVRSPRAAGAERTDAMPAHAC